ncbi:MAG: DNA polymerase III subunit beta [Phycisphaerales bacterium]|nr:DNA polymerase III subunit beta [Phycisphaerales bacterium]
MKAICDRSALLDAVSSLSSVVVARTPKPILTCIKMSAGDGEMTLISTDLEIALQLTITQVDIQQEGDVVIPADKLLQILRELSEPTVSIETDGNDTHLRGADSHFKVLGYPAGEYPPVQEFPSDDRVTMQIDASDLQQLVTRTVFATARENSRYAINGVLMVQDKKKLDFVATDGRRLAVARGVCTPGKAAPEEEARSIIPTKALSILIRLLGDPEGTVSIAVTENQVLFNIADGGRTAILASNMVDGTFPPYEDVIPKDQDIRVSFNSDTLASAVRQAALLTNEESRGVRLNFTTDSLTLSSRAPELGEAEVKIGLESYEGDEIEIGFNPTYITDVLKIVQTEQIQLELKAPTKPGILRAGDEFLCVIMPVNLQ